MTNTIRSSHSPERGASMAAQHPTGEQVLPSQARPAGRTGQRRKLRACQELGVCHMRTPRCADCSAWGFAPGTIEYGAASSAPTWAVYVLVFMVLMLITAGLGLASGYLWPQLVAWFQAWHPAWWPGALP